MFLHLQEKSKNIFTMPFSDNLKAHRAKSGLTQDELAKKMGITRQTIINWEKGVTEPNANEVKTLSKIIGIDFTVFDAINGRENGMTTRETFYRELIEDNVEYSLLPRAVLTDYKIVPDKIIDVIIRSNENEKRALEESKDFQISMLNKRNEDLIEGYEIKIKFLNEKNAQLEKENEELRRGQKPL